MRRLTSKEYFRTISLTYYLQGFSLLLFSGVVFFLITKSDNAIGNEQDWSLIVPVVLLTGMAASYFIFRVMIKRIDPKDKLQHKLPKYASALIVRSALLELPGLFAAIIAYLTLRPYYLGGSLMMFLIFILLRPSLYTLTEDLKLTTREKELLAKPDAIVSEGN
jgi:hypothetical protein